ncbi:hypothetical protein H4Q26_017119 [Puccinia striiformis f. sp. tritici PST-130]|nr:hypothetical protein H4Q26_017119 [Puccinia striiformis f. sp. tritici PST-130]
MPYTSDRPEDFGNMANNLNGINSNHEEVEFKQDHSKVQDFIGGNAIDSAAPSPVTDSFEGRVAIPYHQNFDRK